MSVAGELQSFITATVSTRASLESGSWAAAPHLFCRNATFGVSPTLGQATLEWRVGELANLGDQILTRYERLDLRGKYVRIEINGTPFGDIDWVGYVPKESYQRWPEETFDPGGGPEQRESGNDQTFTAVDLTYFLTRKLITYSMIYDVSTTVRVIERAIGYNTGMGDGRSIELAARGNKDTRGIAFAADHNHAEEWSAHEIVKDLIGYVDDSDESVDYAGSYNPWDSDFDEHPVFRLSSAAEDFLTWYSPTVRTDGRSVAQVLDDVIDRRSGLAWWTSYNHTYGRCEINVTSMATSSVSLPGSATLPAAANQVALGDDPRMHMSVSWSNDRKVDVVVVRGARRRAVFTVSTASGNLVPSWPSTEETAYVEAESDADPKVNDKFRQRARFDRVYSMFHIPPTWDGLANDGSTTPTGTAYACPRPPQGSTSFGSGDLEKFNTYGVRLLRTLPIQAGWDYTDATAPTPRDPDNTAPENQLPFGVVLIDSEWRFLHRLGEGNLDGFKGYDLHVLSNVAGLQIRCKGGAAHAAALNHFDPEDEDTAASDTNPQVDYDDTRYTVCAEFDGYCEARWPTTSPASEPLEEHYIYIDERARFDWLAEDTIFDVAGGSLSTVTTGGPVRDDRDLCEAIAKAAHQWYAVPRAELSVVLDSLDFDASLCWLGDLITTIGTNEAEETVNATVSQIAIDLRSNTAAIQAGFAELDFTGLA